MAYGPIYVHKWHFLNMLYVMQFNTCISYMILYASLFFIQVYDNLLLIVYYMYPLIQPLASHICIDFILKQKNIRLYQLNAFKFI